MKRRLKPLWMMTTAPPEDGGTDGGGQGGDGSGTGDQGTTDKSTDQGGDKGDDADKSDDGDLGYPKDTPVKDMKPEEQIAFHKHKREQNRQQVQAWKQVTGDRTPEQLQAELAELERLRREKMTPDQQAIEDAKASTRQEVQREAGKNAARIALEVALRDLPEADRNASIDILDMSRFLTESGGVDTGKVLAAAERIAPSRGNSRGFDLGAGQRGGSGGKSGVAAGAAMFRDTHPRKTTTS
jgi:hypothetical protein